MILVFSCVQVQIIDWPFEENGLAGQEESIQEYLSKNKFDLVINIPMRQSGPRKKAHFVTHGYRTRRMAIDHSVSLITNIKCAKLFCEVCLLSKPKDQAMILLHSVSDNTIFPYIELHTWLA